MLVSVWKLALNPDCMLAEKYDVIVIGSGIGGLTSAALLAKAGKSVLVIERHDRPGGYAHGFKRKKYWFDSGVHLTSGCSAQGYQGGQVIYKVLQAVDVLEQIEFIEVNPFCHAIYPDFNISLPLSIDAFVNSLASIFPSEEHGLRGLLQLCLKISEEVTMADEVMASADAQLIRDKLAVMFEYRKATLGEVLEQFISEKKLAAILSTNWPYLGLPPSKVSFLYWATMFIGYLVDGAYYCKGGFQSLANALANGVLQNGGKVIYKSQVQRIVVEDGCVQGVLLNSGDMIGTTTVISNADMQQTVYELVGAEYFSSRYLRRMKNMIHSLSIFAVYIATDLDLAQQGFSHEMFCFPDYDHDSNYYRTRSGEITWLSITIPTLIDPDLAPLGRHLVMLTSLIPSDLSENWSQEKVLFLEQMLKLANNYVPGLSEHILYVDSGSPATMERYTMNHQGSAYGWEVTPDQVGAHRMQNRSPLKGLFFAGHWTTPGGGVYGVSVSGLQTAKQVLEISGDQEFWTYLSDVDGNDTLDEKGND